MKKALIFAGFTAGAVFALSSSVFAATVLFPSGGGTGTSSPSGILNGQGVSPVRSTVIGSGLTWDGTTLSATGGSSGASPDWKKTADLLGLTPTTTIGILINASSTIGDGTANGGLTVSGNSTTTQDAYFGDMVGINTPITGFNLSVAGLWGSQMVIGSTSNAGRIDFRRGSDGTASVTVGYTAAAGTSFEIKNTTASGEVRQTESDTGGRVTGFIGSTERSRLNNTGFGIGTTSPFATLSVHANPTDAVINQTIFAVASSTAIATTTVFSVANTGATQITSSNGVTGLTVNNSSGNTGVTVASAAGTGFNAGTVTTGTGLSVTGLSTGNGVNATITSSGAALNFNSTSPAMTSASALRVSGIAAMSADYTGSFVQVAPTRGVTAAGARVHSGSIVSISPVYQITGANAATLTVSGTTTVISRLVNNIGSNASAAISVTAPVLEVSNYSTSTRALTDATNIISATQGATSSTGTVLNVTNFGSGNLLALNSSTTANLFTVDNFGNTVSTKSFGQTTPNATSSFSGQLQVGTGSYYPYLLVSSTTPAYGYVGNTLIDAGGSTNDFLSINAFNNSATACATSDLTANNDISTVSSNFADFGHTSSGFTGSGCTNNPFPAFGTNSTYLFDPNGNMSFALASTSNAKYQFLTGGYTTDKVRVTISNSGNLGIGSSTPSAKLTVHAQNGETNKNLLQIASSTATATTTLFAVNNTGGVQVAAAQPATSTAITLNWDATARQLEYQLGVSATTITLINATTSNWWGSTKIIWVCNPPSASAGALTFSGVEWIGGTVPTQTTTAGQCDVYSLNITRATSTSAYKVAGTQGAGFQ